MILLFFAKPSRLTDNENFPSFENFANSYLAEIQGVLDLQNL
jgi:hypothetical protein